MCSECGSPRCKVVPLVLYQPIICDCCGNVVMRLKDAFAMKIGRLVKGYACQECASAQFINPTTGATDVEAVSRALIPD